MPLSPDDPATIRLATFNILHGARYADGVVDPDRFAQAVRAVDADILALQEVDHHQLRSGGVELTAIAAAAMGAAHRCFVPVLPGTPAPAVPRTGQTGYGIALLSRFPATDWRAMALPRWRTRYPVPRLRSPRIRLRSDEQRGAMAAEFTTPLGPLTVANAHLSYLPGVRERQLRLLVRRLRGLAGPFVLLGDLNLRAPWPARVTRLQPLARHLTFPAERPNRQIDHALTGGGVRAVRSHAVELGVSDHRALVVDVELTPLEG